MADNYRQKKSRRNRVPLSCDPCRLRKLKCNREYPCQNCTTRDEQLSCMYKGSKTRTPPTPSQRVQLKDSMQSRIDHLEELVKKLLGQNENSPSISTASDGTTPDSRLTTELENCTNANATDGTRSMYKGSDDWHDVLEEINDLRATWSQTKVENPDGDLFTSSSHVADGSSLLFGHVERIGRKEIMTSLPPKDEIDTLIRHFFDYDNFPITVAPILHQPTFMREYEDHWKQPDRTHVIWLGLLFSIIGITMLSYHQYGEPPEYQSRSESCFHLYRLRTAQCLIIGDVSKCLPYTLETLRFNATAELNRKDENSRGLWMMTGVMVRAAINMGYHRDPSYLKSLSTLEAEYRRRVWYSVAGMDDLASFQVGFPRMLSTFYSDTLEPRNLHDWELSEDTLDLPSSRPLTERTASTYMIVKGRLFRALGRVTDLSNTPGQVSYDDVLAIDDTLQKRYADFPEHMRAIGGEDGPVKPRNKSEISNMTLHFMYLHGTCVLHRRFMAKANSDPRYNRSRERCISSAMALLSSQHILEPPWYKFSQTRKMFMLADMILFLELEHRRRHSDHVTHCDDGQILQILEESVELWQNAKDSCTEASRAHEMLNGMLSTAEDFREGKSEIRLFDYPRLNSQMSFPNDDHSLQNDNWAALEGMDIDWAMWDSFIDSSSFEEGPIY